MSSSFKRSSFTLCVPKSEFPELLVTVPDSWPHIKLAPWYDVHVGHSLHAADLFAKHRRWMLAEPHVLSWNGGDFIENAIVGSPGIFDQRQHPSEQFDAARELLAPLQHKLLFAIPGNHEARTARMAHFDIAKHLADDLALPYFPDYCFVVIKWRGMKFRLVAHHGSGAATTPGGQRNAARKDMPWVGADLYWTGHLHGPIVDLAYRADYDSDGRLYSRTAAVIISPSYLRYFSSYAATRRMGPSVLGLTVATLQSDGNIEITSHAKGKRL